MPSTFTVPDYGVTIYGRSDEHKRISPGAGDAYVDGEALKAPVVVDKAVALTGRGASVSVQSTDEKPTKKRKKK